MRTEEYNNISFNYVNRDIYGNPRAVTHFSFFLTGKEMDENRLKDLYSIAKKRANKLGFQKYRGREHCDCFVCQAWSLRDTANRITEMINELERKEKENETK